MFILTGTSGNLGSIILKLMLTLVPHDQLVVSSSSTNQADELKAASVELRHGNYADTSTLSSAFAGGTSLLLVSMPSILTTRFPLHKSAIDAALSGGTIKHIYYTSLAFASTNFELNPTHPTSASKAFVMSAHLETENYLKNMCPKCGVKYTILRVGLYTESYPLYLGFLSDESTEVVVSGDGPVSRAAREDLGEAVARILVSRSPEYDDKTIILSGEKAYTLEETTRLIEKYSERNLEYKVVAVGEYLDTHKEKGRMAELWESSYSAIESGETGHTSEILRAVLGRKPKSVEERLEELVGHKEVDTVWKK